MADEQRDYLLWARSYSYLRTAMVGLLVALAAAVIWQTKTQGWSILASVSAYYYTPAQAIFVGALIGLGACMIALLGTTTLEDVLLNVGGICAAVVAIVPTSRGADFETAVRACRQTGTPLLTQKASGGPDCPTVRALADATGANVENNVIALLTVGLLGLAAALFFAVRSRQPGERGLDARFWRGFAAAAVVLALGAFGFFAFRDWFIGHAHFLAATGLLICIIAVAVSNALRHDQDIPPGADLRAAGGALLRSPARLDRYAWLAWVMVAVSVVGVVLVMRDVVQLFWLEFAVAGLFVAFWTVQTIELFPQGPPGEGDHAGATARVAAAEA